MALTTGTVTSTRVGSGSSTTATGTSSTMVLSGTNISVSTGCWWVPGCYRLYPLHIVSS